MELPDGINADGRHVESEILLRFADFHDNKPRAGQFATSLNGGVGSFQGLYGNDHLLLDHDRLADTQTTDFLRHPKTKSRILPLRRSRRSFCQNSFRSNDLRQTKG